MTVIIDNVRPIRQRREYTCGIASLRTIFHYYGFNISEEELKRIGNITEDGTSHLQMRKLANKYNFRFYAKSYATLEDLKKWLKQDCPVIVDYQDYGTSNGKNGHYSVVYGIDDNYIMLSDPANYVEGDNKKFSNNKKMTIEKFLERWWDEDEKENEINRWFVIIRPRK